MHMHTTPLDLQHSLPLAGCFFITQQDRHGTSEEKAGLALIALKIALKKSGYKYITDESESAIKNVFGLRKLRSVRTGSNLGK